MKMPKVVTYAVASADGRVAAEPHGVRMHMGGPGKVDGPVIPLVLARHRFLESPSTLCLLPDPCFPS